MNSTERSIIEAVNVACDHEIPWTRGQWAGWEFGNGHDVVAFYVEDETVHVNVYTGGKARLIAAEMRFAGALPTAVAAVIAHYINAIVMDEKVTA